MITRDQLEQLKDIFELYDDEWLLQRITIQPTINRGVTLLIDKVGCQEFEQLFPDAQSAVE